MCRRVSPSPRTEAAAGTRRGTTDSLLKKAICGDPAFGGCPAYSGARCGVPGVRLTRPGSHPTRWVTPPWHLDLF